MTPRTKARAAPSRLAQCPADLYDDRDRALEAGFDAHLSKPIDPAALTQAIRHISH
jgi:CheY-like chemotaxis protein